MKRVMVLVVLAGCASDPCDPTKQACTFDDTVSTITIAAGHEDEDTCQSWTLHNTNELWVSTITQRNDGGYHHVNWFIVPDTTFVVPDGTWTCSDNGFEEIQAALLGGYLFTQSTQSHEETQTMPTGSAIRIPPHSRLIGASHLLNASDSDLKTTLHLEIGTIPPAQVTAKLAPARIQYHDLHLDASAKSSFTTECDLQAAYPTAIGPFHYTLYFVFSHYHTLGSYTEMQVLGGPHDGDVIMHHDGLGNFGQPIDPPVDLVALGARGVRFTCGYDNPRTAQVGWGIGDQEMCVASMQATTDIGWDGEVNDGTSAKVAAGQYTGPCSVTTYPWDFNK